MKSSLLIASYALLSAMVSAAPLRKRDMVYEYVTEEVVETVFYTTTVYVDDLPATSAPASATSDAKFFEQTSAAPSVAAASSAAAPSSAPAYTPTPEPEPTPTPTPTPTPSPEAPASSAYTPPPPPPPPSSSAAPAPEPSSVYTPPPAPASSQQPQPPAYTPPAYTPPAQTSAAPAPAASSSAPSSGGSHGTTYSGEITYYNPAGGYGACGDILQDTDKVVALAAGMMGGQSNGNPWCGKSITISRNGKTTTAKIADKCPGCSGASIDLTPAVWSEVASDVDGRGKTEWWVNE